MYFWEQLPIGRRNYSPSRRANIQIYNDEKLVLEDKECPICLEKKCNAQLKCLHIYCKQCIILHSTISTTGCPECRTCITEILLGEEGNPRSKNLYKIQQILLKYFYKYIY